MSSQNKESVILPSPEGLPVQSSQTSRNLKIASLGLIIFIMLSMFFPVYGQSDDPAVKKAAARFKNEVITPFEQMWEKGQKLDALHLYLSNYYVILFHYYLAGEVAELLKNEMNSLKLKVKEAQRECGPRRSLKALNDRIALRKSSAHRGMPAVAGKQRFPNVSLPDIPKWGLSRVSHDGKFILFDEQFSEWSEMEAMGPGLMNIEGKYIYRMIDRGYSSYGRFLWNPAGGMIAWHSDISSYNATFDFTSNERVYCDLAPPFDISLSDWSLDGQDILFYDRKATSEEKEKAPQQTKSLTYCWRSGEQKFMKLAEGVDAKFSPDKSHIVYVGGALQSHKDFAPGGDIASGTIYVRRLSDNSQYGISRGMQPIYSPCGTRIAFVKKKGKEYHLIVYDTKSKTTFTAASSGDAILNPAWISKEELIYNIFIPPADEDEEGACDIYWVNTLTHETTPLTSDGESVIDTAWLHTEKEIACFNKILYLEYR